MVELEIKQQLDQLLAQEIERYVAISATATFRPITDIERQVYGVVIIPHDADERPAWMFVLARIEKGYIVIEEDGAMDKPLHQALMVNANIPREQIILAYKGETLPE